MHFSTISSFSERKLRQQLMDPCTTLAMGVNPGGGLRYLSDP